jgi:NTE family protein
MSYSFGLVISGGGSRAAFALGAVKYFSEVGIEFKAYSGASGGAIAASLLASGISANEAFDIIKKIDFKSELRLNIFKGSLYKIKQSQSLKQILPFEKFEELKKQLYINAVDIQNGKLVYFEKGDILEAVLASCSLYPIFAPFKKDGSYYIDGGFMNNLPYEPLVDKVDKIVAINVNPIREVDLKKLTVFKKIKRVLSLMFYANIETRIKNVDLFIEPKEIGRYNFLDPSCMESCFNMGYKYMKNMDLDRWTIHNQRF